MSQEENNVEPSDEAIRRLGGLIAQMGQLEIEIEDIEADVKTKKEKLRLYKEKIVPELMTELGMKGFTTNAGIQVMVEDELRVSFPKDPEKRRAAFDFLKATGNDGIVKREFKIQYGRDSTEWAEKFALALEEMDIREHAEVQQEDTIHYQTLKKFINDLSKAGIEVPLESFGAFFQTTAKIKRG